MTGTSPQNPYAPPGDFGVLPVPPVAPGGFGPQPWQPGEVLNYGWEVFKSQWPVLTLAVFLPGIAVSIPAYVPIVLLAAQVVEEGSAEYWLIYAVSQLVSMTIGLFFQVGTIRIFVAAARGQQAELGTLFTGIDRFFSLLGMTIVSVLLIWIGLLLLVVPGIILALGLCLGQIYCVDARTGPIESLRASWDAMNGQKGKMFVFGLAGMLVGLVGLAACCIGMYPAMAVLWVAFATIYLRRSGRSAPA
jgi:uncharacterized membrane protein